MRCTGMTASARERARRSPEPPAALGTITPSKTHQPPATSKDALLHTHEIFAATYRSRRKP